MCFFCLPVANSEESIISKEKRLPGKMLGSLGNSEPKNRVSNDDPLFAFFPK